MILRRLRRQLSTVVLILLSILSAVAAVAELKIWVAVAAGVVAVITGARVLYAELVLPIRLLRSRRAVGVVLDHNSVVACAVQIAPRIWITCSHVLQGANTVELLVEKRRVTARLVYSGLTGDIALLKTAEPGRFICKPSYAVLEPGDRVPVYGWTSDQWLDDPLLVGLECRVQGTLGDAELILSGAQLLIGFAGAAVLDPTTGALVAIASTTSNESDLKISTAITLSSLPASVRKDLRLWKRTPPYAQSVSVVAQGVN